MATPPAVSVVVPTFERREQVVRAVESVLRQTYRDFELIVADDGSTDGTDAALARFGSALRYVRRENGGTGAARNTGIGLARGEVVAFLDSDDEWRPGHLAAVASLLERHPECVLAGACPGFSLRAEAGALVEVVEPLPRLFVENFVGYPSGVAVRRAELEAVGGFDERLSPFESSDLNLRLALRGPFVLLSTGTVVRHEDATSFSAATREHGAFVAAHERSAERILGDLERRPTGGDVRRWAQGNVHYARALQALAAGDVPAFREEIGVACSLLPVLSTEPELVCRRLRHYLPGMRDPARAASVLAAAAAGWPDRSAPTAAALSAAAAREALRARRPAAAARALGSVPPRPLAAYVRRRLSAAARRRSRAGSTRRRARTASSPRPARP